MTTATTDTAEPAIREFSLGHSPDADDAFMFYPLARGMLDTGPRRYRHILQDIQTLNERAMRGELDVSAVSIHAYAHLQDRYALLTSGASFGDRYGPMIVAQRPMTLDEVAANTIAVPGMLTSAVLALRLCFGPSVATRVVAFDEIIAEVMSGRAAAGLIIHEGQLTYQRHGLHKIIDLGEWWYDRTGGLPLPLGGNAIRRDLGPHLCRSINADLRESIRLALANRQEGLAHALQYGRELQSDLNLADRFVGMYVNELTLDYGDRGRAAVERFLHEGHAAGLTPAVKVEFVE